MWCSICNRDLPRCICEDGDARIASLKDCQFLDLGMIERIEAERLRAKPEIEADRAASKTKANEQP